MDAGHTHVVVACHAGAKELRHARGLLGHRRVCRTGAHHGHVAHQRHRYLRRHAQDARDRIVGGLGQHPLHKLRLVLARTRPQRSPVLLNQPLEDFRQIGVRLALAENHLGKARARFSAGVQLGKAQVVIANAMLAHARASPSDWFMEPV